MWPLRRSQERQVRTRRRTLPWLSCRATSDTALAWHRDLPHWWLGSRAQNGLIIQTAAASNLSDSISTKSFPPPGSIRGLDGTELTLLASDKASGHAVGADLAIIDEAGLLEENRRELWNAVFSSISARDGRLMCISIRGHGPMYSELADRAGKPNVHFTEFAAPEGCDLDDADAWHAANPGLGTIKSLNFMKDAAERAITTPADARSFQGV